ncbi:MAG TPA: hypothetical protein VM939_08350, partial [Gemmatimonadaceae bacterium]|nr:hypothetical protein [Gemmatimonadaceae bacterium]
MPTMKSVPGTIGNSERVAHGAAVSVNAPAFVGREERAGGIEAQTRRYATRVPCEPGVNHHN